MTGRAPRALTTIHRTVAETDRAEYEVLWSALRAAAESRGAHAWRFLSRTDAARFIEFLEFARNTDPRESPKIRDLLSRLDREIAPAETAEWGEC